MDKNRVMALTDGIIAIAATIMVLELSVPEGGLTPDSLLEQWPVLFAYAVSFSLIYLAWRSHHNAFQKADVISVRTYIVNGIWLFFQTLVPFGTGLLGRYPGSRISAFVYVAVVFLWTFTFQFLDASIIADNPGAEKDEVMHPASRVILFGGFALAFGVILIRPMLALLVMAISNVFMGIRIIREKKC